ncbi:hypothetical protein FRC09_009083 [Ceratobasidium sp. 395]|nr:hypothetical protein FRC09_009083 [Ceratobasidium sp. 395]
MARLSFARCLYVLATLSSTYGAVTVHKIGEGPNQQQATATASSPASDYTGSAAYDPTVLDPPAPPGNLNRDFTINLPQGGLPGLSIKQDGSYLGFSIELSVANRAIGTNSSILAVPFLNHIQNVVNRAGKVRVRVGGNTQEKAILRPEGLPGGKILVKTATSDTTTWTPHVEFSPDLVVMLANVAKLIKTEIFLVSAIPFEFDRRAMPQASVGGERALLPLAKIITECYDARSPPILHRAE